MTSREASRSHARPQLLLFRVPFDGEPDEPIEQRRVDDSPLASHIFEYMLIVVKPGIVFTSFR